MDSDQFLSIGEFARRTGLSEKALRLYDRRGLLRPHEVDAATAYRRYSPDQVEDGRLIAMLRAIKMPLAEITKVLAVPVAQRSQVVGRYWYEIERELDDVRAAVSAVRTMSQAKEHGMSYSESALDEGREKGAFAAIARIARVTDLDEAALAYRHAMQTAYWEDKDVTLVTAIAYAGVSRLLAEAERVGTEPAYEARSAAKGLMYDLASFTWTGWNEPGIEIGPAEEAGGRAAARANLAMAIELEKGDLPLSRAHWMLGAHLMTGGPPQEAVDAFAEAATHAERAGAETEVHLAQAFGALAAIMDGQEGAEEQLARALAQLSSDEAGADFVGQVETARSVLGI